MAPWSVSMRIPATTMTTANPTISTGWDRWALMALPAIVAGIPAAAKIAAMRHRTCLARILGITPTAEAAATTISETGMACSMVKLTP